MTALYLFELPNCYTVRMHPNGVDLREICSGSRVDFRRFARKAGTPGEFRYAKSTPFGMDPPRRRLSRSHCAFDTACRKLTPAISRRPRSFGLL
jgi:hypothetical protein